MSGKCSSSPPFVQKLDHDESGIRRLPPFFHQTAKSSDDSAGPSALRRVNQDRLAFYINELSVARLNGIHDHLWLAGLERPARCLHQQIAIRRRIVITETVGLHLLWTNDDIYIKPLPGFLLTPSFWEEVQARPDLKEQAAGLLLSYLWLVCYPSDLRIAHEHGLLPPSLDWVRWSETVESIAEHLSIDTFEGINMRYRFGELRLGRINWVYRLFYRPMTLTVLLRGYATGYRSYGSFLQSNLAWILSAAVYIALVLNAMQVGLSTHELQNNNAFQRASYGFVVLSILGPVALVVLLFLLTGVLVVFNARYAFTHRRVR